MKKVLIIAGIIIALLIAAIIILPLLFKPQIVEMVKSQANKNLNARLEFDDIGLSLIKNFPKLTVTVDRINLANRAPFEGDTLLNLDEFQATVNLSSLVFRKQIEIISIELVKPRFKLITSKDGKTNWDIVPVDTAAAPADTLPPAYSLAIRNYELSDGSIQYIDNVSGIKADVGAINHTGKGDFDKAIFTLSTLTDIADLNLEMAGIKYLNNAVLNIKADLEMDMENKKITFKENRVQLNQLLLQFDGWLATIDSNETNMDISFKAPDAEFKNILSMIPSVYKTDFADLKAEGKLSMAGAIKGTYKENRLPNIDISLTVDKGTFQYPELPTSINNVRVDLSIKNPGRTIDETVIDLKNLHLEILNKPLDIRLMIKTPMSDPYIDAEFKGSLDLAQIKNLIPMEKEVALAGNIRSNFSFKGNKSAIDNQEAQKLKAAGTISVSAIEYKAPDLPVEIKVQSAELRISPQNASLDNLNMFLGESDLQANGGLDNIVGFVLSNQTLKGTLNIKSKYFDLTPWVLDTTQTDTLIAVELPDRIEFILSAGFSRVKIDKLNMTDVKGKLILKDRILKLVNLESKMLQGSMVTDGSYKYIPPEKPHIDFDLTLTDISIPEMYKTFNTVQKAAPLAAYLKGNVGGKLNLRSDLSDSLNPVWESLFSQGSLDIANARVENLQALNKMADLIKLKSLNNPSLRQFKSSYQIKNGKFYLNPSTFKLADYNVTLSGSNGFDKSLDYLMVLEVPSTALSELLKQDLSQLAGRTIDIDLGVKGTVNDPKISFPVDKVATGIAGQLKEAAENKMKAEINQKKKEEEDKLKKELEEKKKDAEKEIKDKLKGLFGK